MSGKIHMSKNIGNRGYEERQQDFDKNWEIITTALSCITIGSLFIFFLLTLELDPLSKVTLPILAGALMLAAPVLFVLSYCRSFMDSKTAKWTLIIVRYPLYMGAVLALANNAMRTAGAFSAAKQETLHSIYILVITVLAVMMLIALGISLTRTLISICRNKEKLGEIRTDITDTPPVYGSIKLESAITYMVIAVIAAVLLRGLTKRK